MSEEWLTEEEGWLREVVRSELGEVGGADWGDWLHELFTTRGAISGPELVRLSLGAQEAAAEAGSQRVAADVARTTGQVVTIAPVVTDYSVRIACDGEYSDNDSGGFFAIGREEAACEVADTVQDILVERWWKVWPMCAQHDGGLHVDLIGGEAAWLCRRGRHYSRVGGLAAGYGGSPLG